jgi:hypothetical protein
MTSLTLGVCDGSFYMDSRAAILEWCNSNMAGQNDHDSYGVIQAGCEKRLWLFIDEEHERGGLTEDTYSKRYVLLWSVLNCALHTSFL